MLCTVPIQILKTLGLLFERWGRCLFNVWIIYFWMQITEFSTANLHLILRSKSGWFMSRRLSQLKFLLIHPKVLPIHHSWNFLGSTGSVDLLRSSLLCFNQCDPNVRSLLGTGAFTQVYQSRDRQNDRRVALRVVIVDGVLDSKLKNQKEQEG